MYLVNVLVTNASLNVNQLFSYYYDEYIEPYKRVEVIFSRAKNKAIVISCESINDLKKKEEELGFKLLKIVNVIDEEPIITFKQFELAKWLSKTTVSPLISCLNTMLPKALRTSKNIKTQRFIERIKINKIDCAYTLKQKEFLLKIKNGMLAQDARKISSSIFNKLKDLNVIEIYKEEKKYIEDNNLISNNFKTLTKDQELVYNSVLKTDKNVSLLFGITGSGKTEVYLHLAKHFIENNKNVLILVPEISLTPQMIERVKDRFNNVIFYHSELSDQERYEQYIRVKNNEARIIVGTRSSIFLPIENLGLIIIDEEHDNSYKQDNMPCYSAINVAKKISHEEKCKVLLASATPSLDSYTRALNGEYNLTMLNKRINNKLPDIEIIDLVKEIKSKSSSYIISNKLKDELFNCLNKKEQAIILLNRRGYSPVCRCLDCGTTLMCRDCDTPLNYHKDENVLKCHQCGKIYKTVDKCPKCNSKKIEFYGFGTKKVEETLKSYFPKARIERFDRDNVFKKGSHKEILDRFGKNEIDILVGTQMISKGLDYPNVSLVGILNADAGLIHQDYNSSKITFDLLMQASGRSGRADINGKVIIQAFNPEHYALKSVLKQDYSYFYNIEMNYRQKMNYPPYSHILEFIVSDTNYDKAQKSINYLFQELEKSNFKVFKPFDLPKANAFHRKRILVLSKDYSSLLTYSWDLVSLYLKQKQMSNIKIDIDPLYLE